MPGMKVKHEARIHRILYISALWLCAAVAECKDDAPLLQKLFRKFKRPKPPKPQVVDDFLSPEEAAYLLDRYEFLMKESRSLGYVKNKAAGTSKYRTSRSVRLPPLGDPITFDIERRAADLAGFNHSYVEDIQMSCYEEDELHGLHRDDADAEVNADRAATVLVYLEAPEGGGGETLFTMRELEDERDLRTGKPLNTEEGALALFRSYCDKPKKHHVVLEPVVGRAVTWRNWLGDDYETFAKSSTHGACPIKKGKKCVIQQWIGRKNKLPLRDERVAAIFPFGADINYQKQEVGEGDADLSCLSDASAREGSIIAGMCVVDGSSDMVQVEDGPYAGIGGLRIAEGGVKAELSSSLIRNGVTISFWARDFRPGNTIVALEDHFSLVYTEKRDSSHTFELRGDGGKSEKFKIYSSGLSGEWHWISVSYQQGARVQAWMLTRGPGGGYNSSISIKLGACAQEESQTNTNSLHIFPLAGENENEHTSMDISFVTIHQEALEETSFQYVEQLGKQAQRYDKNR